MRFRPIEKSQLWQGLPTCTCLACKHSPSPLPRLREVAAQRRVRVDRRVSRLDGPMLTTLSRQRERVEESAGTLNRYEGRRDFED